MRLRKLNHWGITKTEAGARFVGNIVGHPKFEDDAFVAVSEPVGYDPDERIFLSARGGLYSLGVPRRSYVDFRPTCINDVHGMLSGKRRISVRVNHDGTVDMETLDAMGNAEVLT